MIMESRILKNCTDESALFYSDDVLLCSYKEHFQHVEQMLEKLQ